MEVRNIKSLNLIDRIGKNQGGFIGCEIANKRHQTYTYGFS